MPVVPLQQGRAQDQLLFAHLPAQLGRLAKKRKRQSCRLGWAGKGLQRHDVLAPTRLLLYVRAKVCKLLLPMHRLGQGKERVRRGRDGGSWRGDMVRETGSTAPSVGVFFFFFLVPPSQWSSLNVLE
jgi:hypothetical protein